jgi:phosphoglycolate phosphatase
MWKMPRIAAAMRRMMAEEIASIRLFEGTGPFLRRLHQRGSLLGIVSSNSEANVRTVFGKDTAELFRHYECGISMLGKASKLRRAAKLTGIPIENTLYVGDEIRDFEAAKKVGMPFGAVGWGLSTVVAFDKLKPRAVFRTLAEMEEYFTS